MSNDIEITQGAVFTDTVQFISEDEEVSSLVTNRPTLQVARNTAWLRGQLETLDATKEPKFTKGTAFNKDFGSTSGTVTEGNDPRLSDTRTPKTHTHPISQVSAPGTGYPYWNGIGWEARQVVSSDVQWNTIQGVPSYFPSSIALVRDLQSILDGKASKLHTHAISDIIDLVTTLQTLDDTKSDVGHTHLPTDVTGIQTYVEGLIAARNPIMGIQRDTETAVADGDFVIYIPVGTVFKVSKNGLDLDSGWTQAGQDLTVTGVLTGDKVVTYSQTRGPEMYRGVFTATGTTFNVPGGVAVWQVSLQGQDVDFSQGYSTVTVADAVAGNKVIIYGTLGA